MLPSSWTSHTRSSLSRSGWQSPVRFSQRVSDSTRFSSARLLFRHIVPNVAAPVIVQVTLSLSWAILTESSLSFLGLGTQPPDASLGLMVADSRALAAIAWWTLAGPALFVTLAVIGLNLLGDGLRDALDPTGRK